MVDWSSNPHVEVRDDCSVVRSGYLYRPLKLVISANRRTCLELHRIFRLELYAELVNSWDFAQRLDTVNMDIRDGVLFTGDRWHWHYLIDGLANLSPAMLRAYPRIYVDADLTDDQVVFLRDYVAALAGAAPEVVRLEGQVYAVSNVCVPFNGSTQAKVARFRLAVDALAGAPGGQGPQRVYVTRRRAATRRLIGEEALQAILGELGFERLENETMSLSEQLARYRDARIVIGPHGGGLTNMVFAREPRALVELWHSRPQPFFRSLAEALGAQWIGVEGRLAGPAADGVRVDNGDFDVDFAAVRAAVAQAAGS